MKLLSKLSILWLMVVMWTVSLFINVTASPISAASDQIKFFNQDKEVSLPSKPFIENGTLMTSYKMVQIIASPRYKVEWNSKTKQLTTQASVVEKTHCVQTYTVGSNKVVENCKYGTAKGKHTRNLNAKIKLVGNEAFVPIQDVLENLGSGEAHKGLLGIKYDYIYDKKAGIFYANPGGFLGERVIDGIPYNFVDTYHGIQIGVSQDDEEFKTYHIILFNPFESVSLDINNFPSNFYLTTKTKLRGEGENYHSGHPLSNDGYWFKTPLKPKEMRKLYFPYSGIYYYKSIKNTLNGMLIGSIYVPLLKKETKITRITDLGTQIENGLTYHTIQHKEGLQISAAYLKKETRTYPDYPDWSRTFRYCRVRLYNPTKETLIFRDFQLGNLDDTGANARELRAKDLTLAPGEKVEADMIFSNSDKEEIKASWKIDSDEFTRYMYIPLHINN
ncbi:stalk domain-containing protein [Paenibacillus sp. SN-8-1]|uniref:stalk domain-containing protein n=1 Tax=Paenibacillus sp. SN-8-1 TaxID=3435409 RepID=UPI003D9A4696